MGDAVESVHVAMIDEPPRILLVRFDGDPGVGLPRRVTISGLLVPPDPRLSRRMDAAGWTLGGVPVEPRYVLIAGLAPRPPWLGGGLCLIFLAIAATLLGSRRASAEVAPGGEIGHTGGDRTPPPPTRPR